MRYKDLQKKSAADREKEHAKLQMDLLKLRAQIATAGAGKDAGKVKEIRRTIARIMTLKNKEGVAKQ